MKGLEVWNTSQILEDWQKAPSGGRRVRDPYHSTAPLPAGRFAGTFVCAEMVAATAGSVDQWLAESRSRLCVIGASHSGSSRMGASSLGPLPAFGHGQKLYPVNLLEDVEKTRPTTSPHSHCLDLAQSQSGPPSVNQSKVALSEVAAS